MSKHAYTQKMLIETLQDESYFLLEMAAERGVSIEISERLRRRAKSLERLLKAVVAADC